MKPAPHTRTLLTLAIAATISASPALAQDNLALEEVVVTAQKRTESLQDVPISVATFNQQQLEMRVIDDLKDIGADIPNMYVNPFNNDPTAIRLFIRGLGQNDIQITQDPSVALYIDGVYVGTSFGTGFEGVDIERLEVLRGPQGTLYGRNATGGAVNIITRRASTEALEFRQNVTAGNLDKFQSKTILNIPLGDAFATKLQYLYSERDGYVDNDGPGEDFGREDRQSAVADLHWDASDRLTLDYRFEYAENEDTQRLEQVRQLDDSGFLAGLTTFTDDVSNDFLDDVTSFRNIVKNDQELKAHTLWAEWEFRDDMTLRSITGYRDLDSTTYGDALATATGDYTAIGQGVGAPNVGIFGLDYEQFSQEFQLLGSMDQVDYVAGLYYFEDEGDADSTQSVRAGVSNVTDITKTDNDSYAAYAQADWNPDLMDRRWTFTLGARYSKDNRKADRNNQTALPPFTGSYDEDFDNFNPSGTITYDINDDMNVYGKVVTGYKSGGTSTRSANAELFQQGFDEEDIISYELGYKGTFWDSRARLAAAIFYMDIDGLQSSVQTDPVTPAGRDFLPVDDNEVQGAEFELDLLLMEGLTFTAAYGYLDTELGQDKIETPIGDVELIDEFSQAPEHSYTLALDYNRSLAMGELGLNINWGWQDDSNTSVNASDNTVIEDYGLLGAALRWSDIRFTGMAGAFQVLVWGKNLTDEEYGLVNTAAWTTFGASNVQTFGDPRTYGVTLSYLY